MHQDEELHAELLAAFREYFAANQRWMSEGTKRACMDTRYWLHRIRQIGLQRRAVLMEWRKWKNEDMAEKKALKKAQKDQAKTGQGDI